MPKTVVNPMIAEIENRIENEAYNQPTQEKHLFERRLLQDTPLSDDFDKTDSDSTSGTDQEVARKEISLKTMCDGDKTDIKGTCTVKDGKITLKANSTYKNDKVVSLIFENTVVICEKNDVFCDIRIELSASTEENAPQLMFSLLNKSEIRGR